MYIAPDSTIELFRNLKFDNQYSNTMWFTDVTAQNTFFTTHYYLRYNSYTYQRKDIGVVRIGAPISSLYAVDYMRFKNTLFENKWFYAFVDRVEYINNDVTAIHYTIDVIQTYMFDWTLEPCLIERQHSVTDVAGDNLIPEGLELGDYINSAVNSIYKPASAIMGEYAYLFCVGLDEDEYDDLTAQLEDIGATFDSAFAEKVSNQIAMVTYLKLDQSADEDDLKEVLDFLNRNNKIDAIVSITMIPDDFKISSAPYSVSKAVAKITQLNGYTPVNKKLLTYPYCYLDVFNDQNEHQELRFELSTDNAMNFTLYFVTASTPEALLIPQNYNGHSYSPENSLAIGSFPQIAYFNDAYKAWQALNYDQMAVSRQITAQQVEFTKQGLGISQKQLFTDTMISEAQQGVNVFSNLLRGNVGGAVNNAIGMAGGAFDYSYETQKNELAGTKAEYENYALKLRQSADESRAKNLPNSPHVGSASASVSISTKGFWYNVKTIRRQYAERIDKYLTMFGYAQNIVGTPNIHARQYFTYVKTVGSCVSGYIPQDDRETIDTIFDRGIRFWTDYTKFEDYSVNNAILT